MPIDPDDFKNLSNVKEKWENLVNNPDNIVDALKSKFPGGGPEAQLRDWIDNFFIGSVGDIDTGYIKEVLGRLDEADGQRLQNCMIYGPIQAVMSTVEDAFKSVQDSFRDIIDYMSGGIVFDIIYENMYGLWDGIGDSTAILAFIVKGEAFVDRLNDIKDNLQASIDEARAAVFDLSNRFYTWIGTSKVIKVFEAFIDELGCVGSVVPAEMWDYRNSTLKENIDIVHQTKNLSQEDLNTYLEDKCNVLAGDKKSELEGILNNLKP